MSSTTIATATTSAHRVATPVVTPSPKVNSNVQSATAAEAGHSSTPKPTAEELQQAIDASNKVLAAKTSNELHFAMEKGTGLSVVKLINRQSGDTVLQFPSEAILQIARGIDQITGAIIQRKV